jgi:hypothetical protein
VAAVENAAPSTGGTAGTGFVHGWPVKIRLEAGAIPGISHAKALSVGLSNEYFKSLGLPSLFEEASAVTDSNRQCTNPYAWWCARGRRVTAAPMPIKC